MYTVSSLGYRRLTEEERDLEQARVAIEALRALVPIVGGSLPEETTRDFNQVIANMQLAYASAAREEEKDEPEEPGEPSDGDA